MGNTQSTAKISNEDDHVKSLKCYETLLNMGFDAEFSWTASNHYPYDINAAVDFINELQLNVNNKIAEDTENNDEKEQTKQPIKMRNLISHRFVTRIKSTQNNKKDKINENNQNDKNASTDEIDEKDNNENDENDEYDEHTNICTISFGFGEQFNYWDKTSPNYVPKKYNCLRDEIFNVSINNEHPWEYCGIKKKWNEFEEKEKTFYSHLYINKLPIHCLNNKWTIFAKPTGYINKLTGIKPGSKLTHDQILSIVLYTDADTLQTYLKKQYRKTGPNETNEQMKERNGKFHHWLKFLYEVVALFGGSLEQNDFVYHGISGKFLFDRFQYAFLSPISTTTERSVANTFAGFDGIVLQLGNGSTQGTTCFWVEFFSNMPHEKECLIFGGNLEIISIFMNNISYKKEVNVLRFYMNILNGTILGRNGFEKDMIASKNMLIEYINNYTKVLQDIERKNNKLKAIDLFKYIDKYIAKYINISENEMQNIE
eukprot:515698_1